jgi:hypothetical protein
MGVVAARWSTSVVGLDRRRLADQITIRIWQLELRRRDGSHGSVTTAELLAEA